MHLVGRQSRFPALGTRRPPGQSSRAFEEQHRHQHQQRGKCIFFLHFFDSAKPLFLWFFFLVVSLDGCERVFKLARSIKLSVATTCDIFGTFALLASWPVFMISPSSLFFGFYFLSAKVSQFSVGARCNNIDSFRNDFILFLLLFLFALPSARLFPTKERTRNTQITRSTDKQTKIQIVKSLPDRIRSTIGLFVE